MVSFGQQLFFSRSWDLVKKKVAMMVAQKNWTIAWVPDHLRGLPPFAIDDYLSPWTMLGGFAELAPKMTLGVAVTDGIRLHPAIVAQNATSLDHQTGGKFILGIGAGEKMNLTAYGFSTKNAVSRMRETIEILKLLWTQSEPISYKGRFFQLYQAILSPKPIQQPSVPIWVAGNGPLTRRITAELADGWFPFPGLPEIYTKGLREIHQHMKLVGRKIEEVTPGFWGRVYMHEDPVQLSQYINRFRGELALSPWLLQQMGYWRDEYAEIYSASGLDPQRLSLLTYDAEDVAKLDISKFLPLVADIPESQLKTVLLAGTPEDVQRKIEAFVKAGVQHFCFEIINGMSKRNAPFTYVDVSQILAEDIYPSLVN
ncbi:MAG: LLM class flavin-dependent oxidoreductase [Candidatus Thorarchaeota archaeon]